MAVGVEARGGLGSLPSEQEIWRTGWQESDMMADSFFGPGVNMECKAFIFR
jgi:hypothetical protein